MSPDIVVAECGPLTVKYVNGLPKQVVPFLGAECDNSHAQMGIGLMDIDGNVIYFYGLVMPQKLIHFWRAMKLLERVICVDESTPKACYIAMQRYIHPSEQHYLEELKSQIPDSVDPEELRQSLLTAIPTNEVLEEMVSRFHDEEIFPDGRELSQEIAGGTLKPTDFILKLIADTNERLSDGLSSKTETSPGSQSSSSGPEGLIQRVAAFLRP